MKGRHAPGNGARRPPDGRSAEPDPGSRRATRTALRVALILIGLVAAVLVYVLVRDFLDFDHAVRNPQDGFSDWQCASESGTCDH